MNETRRISRRAVLRGVGVSLALPWLESLPVIGSRASATSLPPKRLAVLFMGNGVNGNHWWAKGSGSSLTLGRSLEPLAPIKHKVTVVNGLFNPTAVGVGIHPAQTGNLLSGVPIRRGATVCAGVTMDQVIAAQIGGATTLRSLVLGCEPPADGRHETGYAMTYSSHISWHGPESPVRPEVDASRAFRCVCGDYRGERRRSLLDAVRQPAAAMVPRISAQDRRIVDAYLTEVRDLERRVERVGGGEHHDVREQMRLMCDVTALAFQADRTRVVSLVLAPDLSRQRYPFLGVAADHHAASHDDLSDGYERIVRFHVGQLAALAAKLDAMTEGEGSVLDQSCLLFLSNMWSGWKHDNRKLPVVLVGGLGGTLRTGRAVDYLHAGDEQRKLSSLYLSLMDRMGVRLARFGDASSRLSDL